MMVARERKLPRPTTAELEILQVLWEHGPCTVREVHEVMHRRDGTGYTTALKQLQIMFDKGLVLRNESRRAHVYRAAVSKERTQKKFLSDMLQRVFDGSPSRLVLQALGDHKTSRAELDEIRALLNRLDKEAGP
ncbi:MAG TPA: BlaI/MecI/CopY family transcriptional regulator [Rhodanobacteraceae bacterium]|jgi:predicted transcriptional regulator|nr:BlaI/MecI/CopY family transcriptional regulator [Rhodanobacteraceae bacterium]